jgi:hypothetical protein
VSRHLPGRSGQVIAVYAGWAVSALTILALGYWGLR